MCGICGENRIDGCAADPQATFETAHALAPRGPGGAGVRHDGPGALGRRRLAAIDVSDTGAQPMSDDRCVIVFNGCIYNHVLRMYRQWGDRCGNDMPLGSIALQHYLRWLPLSEDNHADI
jgi:asparagine synthase (glutamine-hydrolysing)